jgi:hypothetical protein
LAAYEDTVERWGKYGNARFVEMVSFSELVTCNKQKKIIKMLKIEVMGSNIG